MVDETLRYHGRFGRSALSYLASASLLRDEWIEQAFTGHSEHVSESHGPQREGFARSSGAAKGQ
jgi:hypothetical protein